jgi:hypothetical protein
MEHHGYGGVAKASINGVRLVMRNSRLFRLAPLARSFKLRLGIDVARGPEEWAYYTVFGSLAKKARGAFVSVSTTLRERFSTFGPNSGQICYSPKFNDTKRNNYIRIWVSNRQLRAKQVQFRSKMFNMFL